MQVIVAHQKERRKSSPKRITATMNQSFKICYNEFKCDFTIMIIAMNVDSYRFIRGTKDV